MTDRDLAAELRALGLLCDDPDCPAPHVHIETLEASPVEFVEVAPGDSRADGRRLGESLVGDASLLELQAQRRLGETIRDVERRLLAKKDLRAT